MQVFIKEISWLIETFSPSLDNQQLVANEMLTGKATESYYEEHNVLRKVVNKTRTCTFGLGFECQKKYHLEFL